MDKCFKEEIKATRYVFASNLKKYREMRNMTQAQLAEAIGLEPESISRLENGKRKPSFDTIGKIACVLNIPVPYLFEKR